MTKEYLLQEAAKLEQVSKKSADEYAEKSDELVSKLNTQMLSRADLEKLLGSNNLDMMKNNHSNHARFISSILKAYHAEVFVDTVLWVFNAYTNHGFSSNYWAAQLDYWIELLKSNLSESAYKEIFPYYEWMQTNIPSFVTASKHLDESAPQHD